jgi:glycosyltransferase involved in cell wall biosynthesis
VTETNDIAPLVGVVVPVRNAGRWLDELLSSLEAQSERRWRAMVVDDGSHDGSPGIARRHAARDPRIAVAELPGKGRGAPTARALGRSLLDPVPPYLYFPDADDVLEPELLETLRSWLEATPEAVAAFCATTEIDEDGRRVLSRARRRVEATRRWSRELPDSEPATPFESIYAWAAPASEAVTMFRTEAYDAAGGWETWPRQGGESIDLLCRLSLLGSVLFVPEQLYRYRRHPDQHSRDAAMLGRAAGDIRAAWRRRAAADPVAAALVERAEFFLEHRLTPRRGLEAAARHARAGRLLTAARFLGGAARRYRWRATPGPFPGRPARASLPGKPDGPRP